MEASSALRASTVFRYRSALSIPGGLNNYRELAERTANQRVTGTSPVGGATCESRSDKGKRPFQIGLLVGLAPPMHPKEWQANAETERAAVLDLA